ncbi:hypothetical protein CsSME_00046040 [Camellia sinensis var. sinensis]
MEVAVAESSLEANDDNLRIEEQLCTPGFLKSLNGADVHGPGISLEVNLGHLYGPVEYNRSDIVVRGPNIQPNGLTNSIWAPKRPSMPTVQTSPHGVRSSRINDQKPKRKAEADPVWNFAVWIQFWMQVNGGWLLFAGVGMDFDGCYGLLNIKLNIKLILLDCLTQWVLCSFVQISVAKFKFCFVAAMRYLWLELLHCSVGSASVEGLVAVSSKICLVQILAASGVHCSGNLQYFGCVLECLVSVVFVSVFCS